MLEFRDYDHCIEVWRGGDYLGSINTDSNPPPFYMTATINFILFSREELESIVEKMKETKNLKGENNGM